MSEEKMFCPNCGSECEKSEKFCGSCGAVITTDEKEKVQIERTIKYDTKKNKTIVTPVLVDYIGFLIGVSVVFAFAYGWIATTCNSSSLGKALSLGFGVLIGISAIFVLSALARFNAIQRQINNMQETICNLMNERFNSLEDKE